MKTVCIMCPVGCELSIEKHGKEIVVSGNACKRGETYGASEITNPVRVVTSVVKAETEVLSVKTSKPVPKQKIAEVLKNIEKIHIKFAKMGEILQKNVANTDADIVVTGKRKLS